MNKYRDKSDFEINKAVAIAIGFPCYYGDGSYTNGLGLRTAVVKGKNINGNYMVGGFDPCNNPADAMPIVIDNKISLYAPRLNEDWMAEYAGSTEDVNDGFQVDYFDAHNQNPLRAAMEVFLMMKDAENEKV